MNQTFETYAGQFLIAMPEMPDPSFRRTVSLICEHNKNGAIGVMINRKHPKLKAKDVFDDIKVNCIPAAYKVPVYIGGPAKSRQIFIIHGAPFYWKGTVKVTSEIAITTSLDIIHGIAIGEGPKDFMITLGYCGWDKGQLEAEMMSNSWFLAPADETIMFDTPVDLRWLNAGQRIGINPNLICNVQGTRLC